MGTSKVAAVAVSAVAVLGIGLVLVLRESDKPQAIEAPAGVILIAASTDEGMEAAFDSRLDLTAEGCLGLAGQGESEARVVAVFPAGTSVVADNPLTIRVNGKNVAVGQSFSGGGGMVDNPTGNELLPSGPAKCLSRPIFLINKE